MRSSGSTIAVGALVVVVSIILAVVVVGQLVDVNRAFSAAHSGAAAQAGVHHRMYGGKPSFDVVKLYYDEDDKVDASQAL